MSLVSSSFQIFFLLLLSFSLIECRNVFVEVEVPWSRYITSPIIEVSEFLYQQQSKSLFWKYIDSICMKSQEIDYFVTINDVQSISEVESLAIKIASEQLPSNSSTFFLETLQGLNTFAPTVEFYHTLSIQYGSPCGVGNSYAIFYPSMKVICNIQDFTDEPTTTNESNTKVDSDDENVNEKKDGDSSLDDEKYFDHIFPSKSSTTVASTDSSSLNNIEKVILYGSIGTSSFCTFHTYFSHLPSVTSGAVVYSIRHAFTGLSPVHTHQELQGFGVFLDIKNMEYKTVDDNASHSDSSASSGSSKDKDISADNNNDNKPEVSYSFPVDEEVGGIIFSKLLERKGGNHSPLGRELTILRSELLEQSAGAAQEMKVWKMKELGLQTLQAMVNSMTATSTSTNTSNSISNVKKSSVSNSNNNNAAAGIQKMIDIIQNFPLQAPALSALKVSQKIKDDVMNFWSAATGGGGGGIVHTLLNAIFINGHRIDLSSNSFNVYDMLLNLRGDIDYLDQLNTLTRNLPSTAKSAILHAATTLGQPSPPTPSPATSDTSAVSTSSSTSTPQLPRVSDVLPPELNSIVRIDLTQGAKHVVVFANNLEKDAMYKRYPKKLIQLTYPSWQLQPLSRNLYTLVAVVDPTSMSGASLLVQMNSMLEQQFPVRFGLVLICSDKHNVHNKNKNQDSSSNNKSYNRCLQISRLFAAAKDQYSHAIAASFLSTIADVVASSSSSSDSYDGSSGGSSNAIDTNNNNNDNILLKMSDLELAELFAASVSAKIDQMTPNQRKAMLAMKSSGSGIAAAIGSSSGSTSGTATTTAALEPKSIEAFALSLLLSQQPEAIDNHNPPHSTTALTHQKLQQQYYYDEYAKNATEYMLARGLPFNSFSLNGIIQTPTSSTTTSAEDQQGGGLNSIMQLLGREQYILSQLVRAQLLTDHTPSIFAKLLELTNAYPRYHSMLENDKVEYHSFVTTTSSADGMDTTMDGSDKVAAPPLSYSDSLPFIYATTDNSDNDDNNDVNSTLLSSTQHPTHIMNSTIVMAPANSQGYQVLSRSLIWLADVAPKQHHRLAPILVLTTEMEQCLSALLHSSFSSSSSASSSASSSSSFVSISKANMMAHSHRVSYASDTIARNDQNACSGVVYSDLWRVAVAAHTLHDLRYDDDENNDINHNDNNNSINNDERDVSGIYADDLNRYSKTLNLLSQSGISSVTLSEIAAKVFEDSDDVNYDGTKTCSITDDGSNSCQSNSNNNINDDIMEKDVDSESNESVVVSAASLQFLINHSSRAKAEFYPATTTATSNTATEEDDTTIDQQQVLIVYNGRKLIVPLTTDESSTTVPFHELDLDLLSSIEFNRIGSKVDSALLLLTTPASVFTSNSCNRYIGEEKTVYAADDELQTDPATTTASTSTSSTKEVQSYSNKKRSRKITSDEYLRISSFIGVYGSRGTTRRIDVESILNEIGIDISNPQPSQSTTSSTATDDNSDSNNSGTGIKKSSLVFHLPSSKPPTSTSSSSKSTTLLVIYVLDPLSLAGQRATGLIKLFQHHLGLSQTIVLAPHPTLTEFPLQNFYRSLLSPRQFTPYISPLLVLSSSADNSTYSAEPDVEAVVDTTPIAAVFTSLPRQHTLTVRIDAPEAWNIQAISAVQDIDNLRCSSSSDRRIGCGDPIASTTASGGTVLSDTTNVKYTLKSLLIAGQCFEHTHAQHRGSSSSGSNGNAGSKPPNGLQLILSPALTHTHATATANNKNNSTTTNAATAATQQLYHSDTLVMQNLGYFQLQANPGLWRIGLARGRATALYTVDGSGVSDVTASGSKVIAIQSFADAIHKLDVTKRRGKEHASLLSGSSSDTGEDEGDDDGNDDGMFDSIGGIWNSLSSTMFGTTSSSSGKTKATVQSKTATATTATEDNRIHVFSLATGHMYERLLRIMMLSVTKRTSMPVKFWLFENFLSPSFKQMAAVMSKTYGFEVGYVTYKWPEWLTQQTQKQRIIWGYKILFLDVLFPLHVKKVIYVDADQVLRADLKELWDLDLHGKPYAYTPFCTSRKETLGFQFWREGYWQQHLAGKPYHISALYVVDLQRFRRYAVGDQLRAIYDGLARDPNSLANLDQDLPNYAQHSVPIHSLPQEWLWCETWCSDDSKVKAKTIDLCNNPLHKEPKLDMARRIVSGKLFNESWVELDTEIRELQIKHGFLSAGAGAGAE